MPPQAIRSRSYRNFRAAASRLNITQPAVWARVAALEAELGVVLFDRSAVPVELTSKGMSCCAGRSSSWSCRVSFKRVASAPGECAGTVRIGTTSNIVSACLPDLLREFSQDCSGLGLELQIDTSERLRARLVAGELDVVFAKGATLVPGIRNTPLTTHKVEWIASASMPLPPPVPLEVIANHLMMTYLKETGTCSILEGALRAHSLWPVRLGTSSSTASIIRIVESGLAIGAIMTVNVRRELAEGRLRIVASDLPLPSFEYMASCPINAPYPVADIVSDIVERIAERSREGDGGDAR